MCIRFGGLALGQKEALGGFFEESCGGGGGEGAGYVYVYKDAF